MAEVIPVVWLSYQKPTIISRGYWDQGLLERVLDRRLWRPVDAIEYSHHDGFANLPIDADGAVVVLPAQHHVEYVGWLNDDLSCLKWVVLILTGDECSLFPWQSVVHPNMRLWIMTPRPQLHRSSGARFIGEGWHEDTPDVLSTFTDEAMIKPLDWFFAGQVTHSRREECVVGLRGVGNGQLICTPGFTQGLDRHDYLRMMAQAKIVPCPSGPGTPDSFRLYEALEAGCVPLADAYTPDKWPGYWEGLLGDVPFPVVDDWSQASVVIRDTLADWPDNANRIGAWWQAHKRSYVYALDEDVRAMTDIQAEQSADDLITILMPTSPIPSHPKTGMIEETIDSIRQRLPHAEILLMVDGVRAEQADRRDAYSEYVRRLIWMSMHHWHNVLVLNFEEHLHQGLMTRRTLEQVRTPTILFVEHDTPLCGSIPFEDIARTVMSGDVYVVRLHHEANVLEPHEYLMLDRKSQDVHGVPMKRTVQWSQRPHVASSVFYKQMAERYFGLNSRTMIEDVMYGVVENHWREHSVAGWEKFKLWMYTPEGDIKRSYHLDGRETDPKYDMKVQYDGETPELAPFPGVIS